MAGYSKTRQPLVPSHIDMPMSVSGLAEACGVSRQRIYTLIQKGLIAAVPMSGGYVIMPEEAKRAISQRVKIRVRSGAEHTRFDFSRI